MKITAQTTLVELAIELGKFGVTDLSASIVPGWLALKPTRVYRVDMIAGAIRLRGEGGTLDVAIDDALARLTHRMFEPTSE